MANKILSAMVLLLPLGMWLAIPLPWPGIRLSLFDILALIVVIAHWGDIWRSRRSWWPLLLFLAVLGISWLVGIGRWGRSQIIISGLYLGKTAVYYLILPVFSQTVRLEKRPHLRYFLWAGAGLIFIGVGQYLLSPDFRSWRVLGWDPHMYRLVGSFYDPGFLATLYLLFFIFWSTYWKAAKSLGWLTLSMIAVGLTYSRANWLLALISIVLVYWKSKTRSLAFLLIAVVILISVLPRNTSEGTRWQRSASIRGRFLNSQQAIKIIRHHWLLGVGYNNLSAAKNSAINKNSHSLGGFENSYLFVLATSGLIGFLAFSYFLFWMWQKSSSRQRALLAVFALSGLFNNTLFYSLIVWPFWGLWVLARDGR